MPIPLLHYLYPSNLQKYHRTNADNEPSWALITGSTDGIGLALAHALATHGFNIVLHGRNSTKLARVSSELSTAHPKRSFRTVTVDATSFTSSSISSIVSSVADIPLTILINNVGGTAPLSSNFKHFENTTPEELTALYNLNVLFPLNLTRALLPQLQAQSGSTLILTCGSQAQIGQPFVAAYSGCKAALHAWSRALAAEQADAKSSVDVMEVVVAGTYTQNLVADPNMHEGLFMPSAEKMARAIVARVGHRHRSVVPWFWHGVQAAGLYWFLPGRWADAAVAGVLRASVEEKGKGSDEGGKAKENGERS